MFGISGTLCIEDEKLYQPMTSATQDYLTVKHSPSIDMMLRPSIHRSNGSLQDRQLPADWLKLGKFYTESEFFLEIGGIWNRGEMHHCLRGDGRHCVINISELRGGKRCFGVIAFVWFPFSIKFRDLAGWNSRAFCDGTRRYGVPGNENYESIVCMSVLY